MANFFRRAYRVIAMLALLMGSMSLLAWSCDSCHAQQRRSHPGLRRSNFGWEAQGKHFVVLDPASGSRAAALLKELEQGFSDADSFSDNWRQRPTAQVDAGLIPVRLATDRPENPGRRFRADAATIAELGEIVLPRQLADLQDESGRRKLRAVGAKSQLEISGLAARVPAWVTDGLAEYIASPYAPIDWFEATPPSDSPVRADAIKPVAGWIPYLINADDAATAPRLFDLLAAAMQEQAPPFRKVPVGRYAYRRVDPPVLADEDFIRLFRDTNQLVAYDRWPGDAASGLPVISRLASEYDTLPKQRQLEMAQLLKLAQKFGPADAHVLGDPRQATNDGRKHFSQAEPQVTIDGLRRKFTSGQHHAWSTLDLDGSLLTWVNRDRLTTFLDAARRDYRFVWQEQQSVLEWKSADGETYHAWLEVDERLPSRPVVHFKLIAQPG